MNQNNIVKCDKGNLVQAVKNTYPDEYMLTDVVIIEATEDKWVVSVKGIYFSEDTRSREEVNDLVFVSQFTQSYYRIER
jgi:hypothetical protein